MDGGRLTGPQAGVVKYDFLTALAVAGLHGPQVMQTSVLRLIALVTARYNWRTDELTVGQRDMARLWGCTERTVKREIKRLTAAGLLRCLRPGVRGRVAAYRLDRAALVRISDEVGAAVGPDFGERMALLRPAPATVVRVDFGGDVPAASDLGTAPTHQGGRWQQVAQRLRMEEPSLYANWFSKLSFDGYGDGTLALRAETRFIARYIETRLGARICEAAERELGPVDRLIVTAES